MAESSTTARRSMLSRVRIIHAVTIVPFFIVALLVSGVIRDNSFLWHIRAGSAQQALGSVIVEDPFSFTALGETWRTQSWLAELFYAWAESTFSSLVWVNWMVLVVASLTVALVGLAAYRSVPSPVVVGLTLVLAVWLLGPFFQPRPVILSFLFLALLVAVLQNGQKALWAVVPIMWIWAGVHGSWVIGGLLIVLEWIRTADRQVFKVGAVSLVATLATAHGIGTWLIVFDFLGAQEALDQMQEWQVPNFTGPAQAPYLALIAGVIVAGIRGKIAVRDLFVVIPFMFFGMTSHRTVVPAAIVLIPWAVRALPTVRVPRSSTSPAVAVAAVAVIGLVVLTPMARDTVGELYPERFPSDEARSHIEGRNPYYDDGVGGYLIYAEWPDRLVWIDDRAELHGAEPFIESQSVRAGRYEEVFVRYGFDAAMSKPDWDLTKTLIGDGWAIEYEDEYFVILVP